MGQHRQKWVKVNTQVDERLADLICALSRFPKLRTIESCQGNGYRSAWICFQYGDSYRELSEFVLGFFGKELNRDIDTDISIRITESGIIRGELLIRPDMIEATTTAIKRLARRWKD